MLQACCNTRTTRFCDFIPENVTDLLDDDLTPELEDPSETPATRFFSEERSEECDGTPVDDVKDSLGDDSASELKESTESSETWFSRDVEDEAAASLGDGSGETSKGSTSEDITGRLDDELEPSNEYDEVDRKEAST